MRYTPQYKEAVRHRLIDQARLLSKANGFQATGIDQLMRSVGLSGAAFYRHFTSKEDLFATVIGQEMAQSLEMLAGDAQSSDADLARCLRSYLSFAHAIHAEDGCVIPALGAEIARAGPEHRRLVEASLAQINERWSERLEGDAEGAWNALAQCVGALLLARVVERDDTRRKILSAVRRSIGRQFGFSSDRATSPAAHPDQHNSKK